MTNPQLLHAIGEIDDHFITETAPNKPKRHMIRWYAAVACLCLVMVGIGLWQGGLFTKPAPLPAPNGTETVPEAIGGDDNHAYHYAYLSKLYMMDNELITLLEQQGHNYIPVMPLPSHRFLLLPMPLLLKTGLLPPTFTSMPLRRSCRVTALPKK